MRLLLPLAFALLAACGANGDPEPVGDGPAATGDARIGVVGGV